MILLRIATITEKSTGHRYEVYRVPGDHGVFYNVWVRNNYACRCPCKSKQFHPHKPCKHQVWLQQSLDEQRRTAPLHRQTFSMLK